MYFCLQWHIGRNIFAGIPRFVIDHNQELKVKCSRRVYDNRLFLEFDWWTWRSWTKLISNYDCSRRFFSINFSVVGWDMVTWLANSLWQSSTALLNREKSAMIRSEMFYSLWSKNAFFRATFVRLLYEKDLRRNSFNWQTPFELIVLTKILKSSCHWTSFVEIQLFCWLLWLMIECYGSKSREGIAIWKVLQSQK